MKNRDYKKSGKGAIVHVYNRGNNREKIFCDEQDYKAFMFRLGLTLGFEPEELKHELLFLPFSRIRISNPGKDKFILHNFCLMPNHFHLLIEQQADISIAKLMSQLCTSYAKYFNKKYGRVGHVFQDQFKSVLMESNSQLMWTCSYIHTNPIKDKLVNKIENYKWSSYNDFVSDRKLPIVSTAFFKELFGSPEKFKQEMIRLSDVKDAL
ncbi:MAG: transposase [Patescibacteria group bacterium]